MLYFEDFLPGQVAVYGPVTITAQDIIAFASEYDPQPMHTDEEAARGLMLGGLAASGWHTCCLFMRLICDSFLLNSGSLGAPGIEEVKFRKPIHPGDQLTLQMTVGEVRVSASRPQLGLIDLSYAMHNQTGACVMTLRNVQMMRRRPEAGTA